MKNYTVIRELTLSNKLTFRNCDSLEFLLRISYWYNNTKGKLSAIYLGSTVRGIYFSLFHSSLTSPPRGKKRLATKVLEPDLPLKEIKAYN